MQPGKGGGGAPILLFEEEPNGESRLANLLQICGMDVTLTEDPKAVVRFAAAMTRSSTRLLIVHLSDFPEMGWVLLDKIRLIRTVPQGRVFVVMEPGARKTSERLKERGYENALPATASPSEIVTMASEALYPGPTGRKVVRILVNLPAEILFHGQRLPALVTNQSDGGAFVECRHLLPEGAELAVRFELAPGQVVLGKGIVVYKLQKEAGAGALTSWGMGVRFTHMNRSGRPLLQSFLREELVKAYTTHP